MALLGRRPRSILINQTTNERSPRPAAAKQIAMGSVNQNSFMISSPFLISTVSVYMDNTAVIEPGIVISGCQTGRIGKLFGFSGIFFVSSIHRDDSPVFLRDLEVVVPTEAP